MELPNRKDKKNSYNTQVCERKKTFRDKDSARKRSIEINDIDGNTNMKPYQCNICENWHLTSKSAKQRKKIKKRIKQNTLSNVYRYEEELKNVADYWIKKKQW